MSTMDKQKDVAKVAKKEGMKKKGKKSNKAAAPESVFADKFGPRHPAHRASVVVPSGHRGFPFSFLFFLGFGPTFVLRKS